MSVSKVLRTAVPAVTFGVLEYFVVTLLHGPGPLAAAFVGTCVYAAIDTVQFARAVARARAAFIRSPGPST